jgi:hypothetical protein
MKSDKYGETGGEARRGWLPIRLRQYVVQSKSLLVLGCM